MDEIRRIMHDFTNLTWLLCQFLYNLVVIGRFILIIYIYIFLAYNDIKMTDIVRQINATQLYKWLMAIKRGDIMFKEKRSLVLMLVLFITVVFLKEIIISEFLLKME